MFTLQGKHITVTANEAAAIFSVALENGDTWSMQGRAYVALSDGRTVYLDECPVIAAERTTGIWHGYTATYDLGEGLTLHTSVYIEHTRDDLYFENRLDGDALGQISAVSFPSAVNFDCPVGHGYTVLPRMQGALVPAGSPIRINDGSIFERDAYMPLFGQVRDGSGYMAVIDTPYDAKYALRGEDVEFYFRPSLGKMAYPRRILYRFMEGCDYNDFAHSFRAYLEERGEVYTLLEKAAKNPNVEKLFGCPVIHTAIATHISPDSDYYKPDDPDFNDNYVTFDTRAAQLRILKEKGLDKAYLHFDGWGKNGYDNLHPDPFPPHEAAGGAEGMKRLADTARELGYIFGIHDQYRDYYYDAPTFDFENAIQNIDGSHPFCSIWYGGKHSFLCATLAADYVRRNFDEFDRLGIDVQAAYLDVFSVVTLDECFNPDHPMTREGCAIARNECLHHLSSRGIIPSSEETIACLLPSLVLCHHSPYFPLDPSLTDVHARIGVPLPLFNMVYHDCVVTPWTGLPEDKGDWYIPGTDSPYTHAILNGGPVYCPIDATDEQIKAAGIACASSARLTHERVVRHEFLDETYRRQRTTWTDGTVIEVNFDSGAYTITCP